MMTMKLTNNQTALDYAIYMIVGSYFRSTYCKNVFLERRMRLQYLEQKNDAQYRMERACIAYFRDVLYKELPVDIWKEDVQVRMVRRLGKENIEIRFEGEDFILSISGKMRGKKVKYLRRFSQK